ncbi:MAG TPA: bifunctional DNA-binding transcriptional regulator/O6-methylguanine-DNA methyltransferase Ada [Thermomicrobiaceae bacterium]|nr:bifunctional DNA-binding transcriptional regulator/O6-methylguanine-DNA methyltransferase Ada [Thermomicrobiaceae bacterium]
MTAETETTATTMTTTILSDDQRWDIVAARDAAYDGAFVYGVRSTGIYCRPGCPARRPGRAQVRFFDGPDAAEQAGFRACRRCQPRESARAHPSLAERARRWIEAHGDEPFTLARLGRELGVSPAHLQRTFTAAFGVSPRQYAEARRFQAVKERLRAGDDVTRALYDAGYGSSSRFYEQANGQLGMAPGAYRRGGQGVSIAYTIVDCPLGRLLVAATARGICAVSLGVSDEALETFLREEFPAAEIERDDAALRDPAAKLLAHLDGRQAALDLPLDVSGTDFQRQVWETLRMIPYGETRSYAEVAEAIGQPRAVRAVARACGSNRAALVIPCHRVVRSDGSLGGYRWGVERKEALLSTEREARSA